MCCQKVCMYTFIPKTSSGTVIRHKNFQPFNPELKQLIHKKHRLWNRWLSTRDEKIHKEYKKIRNKVKSETQADTAGTKQNIRRMQR